MEDELDPAFMAATEGVPDTLDAAAQTGAAIGIGAPAQPIEPAFVITPSMVQMLIEIPFNSIAEMVGEGGEFWRLQSEEARNLGQVWCPIVEKLLNMWGLNKNGGLIFALLMTSASLAPRLAKERTRRASPKVITRTAPSGDSTTSRDQPTVESPESQTDSLAEPIDA